MMRIHETYMRTDEMRDGEEEEEEGRGGGGEREEDLKRGGWLVVGVE